MSRRRPHEIAAVSALFAAPVVLCAVVAYLTGIWALTLLGLAPAALAFAMAAEPSRPALIPVRVDDRRRRTR